MALLQNVIGRSAHSGRPAAGSAGVLWIETDTLKVFRDNGATWDEIDLTAAIITAGILAQAQGGTGIDTSGITDGQLLIGKTSDHSLNKAALTAGTNVTITNAAGAITIAASGGGGSLTSSSAYLSSTVSMTNANTFYDGPTLSLAAGTWLILAFLMCEVLSTNGHWDAKIWDGTTAASSGETSQTSGLSVSTITLAALVAPGGTTTYKMSIACTGAGNQIRASTPNNAAGNTASGIIALKVA